METTKKQRFPFGFYVCSFAFTLERFAFYSAKWLMAGFIAKSIVDGGLGLTDVDGAKAQANLVAFTYLGPMIGSYISDHWIGAKYLVPVGMVLMGAGYLVGWQAYSLSAVYTMIILVSLGTALFKTQTNSITGRLFSDKANLAGAFSTQYSFVNVGSFIGTTSIGVIVAIYGFRFCFLICAVIMFINALWFLFGWRFLGEAGKKPFKIDEHAKTEEEKHTEKKPLTSIEKKRISAIVIISVFSIVFWLFWYLAYMPVYYHWGATGTTAARANWMIGNFEIPTSWFDSLNALCCIVLGPALGSFWIKRAHSPKGDWNMFQKTAIGLFLLGLSYVVMSTADVVRGANQASILWIILFGIILSLGEMVFSPLGNSFIAKYAPPRLLSNMMAVWVLAVFFAGKSYGYLYEYTKNFKFSNAYFTIAGIAIAFAVILWAVNPKLNALVEEDAE